MKFFSILCASIILLSSSMAGQDALAKDKSYKFNFRGYVSKQIDNQDDLALLKASEYSLKKGYDYFVIENIRRFDRAKQQRTVKFGRRTSTKPQLRTEMRIHCYDAIPDMENVHNANETVMKINQNYPD